MPRSYTAWQIKANINCTLLCFFLCIVYIVDQYNFARTASKTWKKWELGCFNTRNARCKEKSFWNVLIITQRAFPWARIFLQFGYNLQKKSAWFFPAIILFFTNSAVHWEIFQHHHKAFMGPIFINNIISLIFYQWSCFVLERTLVISCMTSLPSSGEARGYTCHVRHDQSYKTKHDHWWFYHFFTVCSSSLFFSRTI